MITLVRCSLILHKIDCKPNTQMTSFQNIYKLPYKQVYKDINYIASQQSIPI